MSEQINDGDTAFPVDSARGFSPGMSLRDYLAANASSDVVAMLVRDYLEVCKINEPEAWDTPLRYSDWHCEKLAQIEARYRYSVADNMLRERTHNKQDNQP